MIQILDNFCPHYDKLVQQAQTAKYGPYEAAGVIYPNIAITDADHDAAWAFTQFGWTVPGYIYDVLSGFRAYHHDTPDPMHWIHSDASVSNYSAILSVAPPGHFNGSLCFWRHKQTGWLKPDISNPNGVVMTSEDAGNRDAWDRQITIRMEPNRCVIFPAALYHSRWPKHWHDTSRPRIVQVFFFDVGDEVYDLYSVNCGF